MNISPKQSKQSVAQDDIKYTSTTSKVDKVTQDTYTYYSKTYRKKIKFNILIKKIIDHYAFQRLNKIRQLGVLPLNSKFITADYTRYVHSIDCAYLGSIVAESLQKKHKLITDREVLCVICAALCHDLGHGAFSHTFDHLLNKLNINTENRHHEVRSMVLFEFIIRDLRETQKCTEEDMTDEEIGLVQYFIDTKMYRKVIDPNLKQLPRYYLGLEQIVNNAIHGFDIDKLDYITKDTIALRFDNTLTDRSNDVIKFLKRCVIVEGTWRFHQIDEDIVSDYILRRSLFHSHGYVCKIIDPISTMLQDALELANCTLNFASCVEFKNEEQIRNFCQLTDDYLIELILNSKNEKLSRAKELIENIIEEKNLYKFSSDYVSDQPDHAEPTYHELNRYIFTDKSQPVNLLPKVLYHNKGQPVVS